MNKIYTLPLFDELATLENVGGKGMSLSKLIEAGIPVPDGFHVTTDAYKQYMNDNEISDSITALLDSTDPSDTNGLEAVSQKISELFAKGVIPSEIEKKSYFPTTIWDYPCCRSFLRYCRGFARSFFCRST